MPYPPDHREQTRKQIVRAARKLFNRFGLNGVSIDDIMAEAGLTRGGFYSYFQSKGELYSEAVTLILTENPAETYEGIEGVFGSAEVAPRSFAATSPTSISRISTAVARWSHSRVISRAGRLP